MLRSSVRCLAAFGAVLVLSLGLSGCGINTIPTQDEQVKASWSQVLNEYKRRSDLVPNLVATVKGFANQEKTVLTQVIEARAKATQTTVNLPADVTSNPEAFKQFEQSQNGLTQALGRLMVVSERYPDLKSNQNFMVLQSQLEGTENRIAVARKDYIDAVQQYNTTLRTIPQRWYAAIFYPDAKVKQTFSISEQEQQTPHVQF